MAMKILIDWDLCESNFVCNDVCPDVFRVDEAKDELVVVEECISESIREDIEKAALTCPKGAIELCE